MKHLCPSRTVFKSHIFVIDPLPGLRYAQAAHTGGSLTIFEILTSGGQCQWAIGNLVNYETNCRLLCRLWRGLRTRSKARSCRLVSGVTWGVGRVKWRGTGEGRGGPSKVYRLIISCLGSRPGFHYVRTQFPGQRFRRVHFHMHRAVAVGAFQNVRAGLDLGQKLAFALGNA